jgi:hypothetical protein
VYPEPGRQGRIDIRYTADVQRRRTLLKLSHTSRPVWLILVVCLLSVCVFALTTQSRLCLYDGDTIIDHYLNKSTKTTEARDKAEFPPQATTLAPKFDLTPEPAPLEPLPLEVPVMRTPPAHPPFFSRPPPQFS